MALTLMYEQALQAVNPAVTVPYWDFTLESTFFGASDFRTSGVFADDWFGEATTDNVRPPVLGLIFGLELLARPPGSLRVRVCEASLGGRRLLVFCR